MTSYQEHERAYYDNFGLSDEQTAALIQRIRDAQSEQRPRLSLVSFVHWAGGHWECYDTDERVAAFHRAVCADKARTSQCITRVDLSVALTAQDRFYQYAAALLDHLDVCFFCSYVVHSRAHVVIPDRSRWSGLARFLGAREATCALDEYCIVVDFPLTLTMRRGSELQKASSFLFGDLTASTRPAASASASASVSALGAPRAAAAAATVTQAHAPVVVWSRSNSHSHDVQSRMSAHSSSSSLTRQPPPPPKTAVVNAGSDSDDSSTLGASSEDDSGDDDPIGQVHTPPSSSSERQKAAPPAASHSRTATTTSHSHSHSTTAVPTFVKVLLSRSTSGSGGDTKKALAH